MVTSVASPIRKKVSILTGLCPMNRFPAEIDETNRLIVRSLSDMLFILFGKWITVVGLVVAMLAPIKSQAQVIRMGIYHNSPKVSQTESGDPEGIFR